MSNIKTYNYSIKDFFLGEADGEDEALANENFQEYYYDYDEIIEKAMKPLKYLILGKKGAGKTLLGEYINKKLLNTPKNISAIIPFQDFRMHELRELHSGDTPPNEYIPIWNYILLIELSKVIIKNEEISDHKDYIRVKSFLDKNYKKLILTQNASLDLENLKKFNADFIAPVSEEVNQNYDSFIYFIPYLENLVISLLDLDTEYSYTLILDKLDDRFEDNDLYKNSLISLIKALDNLNKKFLRGKHKVKIMALIRSDIFSLINDTDLNKREQSNAVKIDWGDIASYKSPLFDMIVKKIKISTPELVKFDSSSLIKEIFPRSVRMGGTPIPTDKFLLSRTLFRPRDLITYLKYVVDESEKEDQKFTEKAILAAERNYSEYFIKELENEMKGHVRDEVSKEIKQLILKFGNFNFNYEEIKKFHEKNKILSHISLDEALKIMFDFSIIGNFRKNQQGHIRFAWKHRHDSIEVDFRKEFRLHYGLWRYFNV